MQNAPVAAKGKSAETGRRKGKWARSRMAVKSGVSPLQIGPGPPGSRKSIPTVMTASMPNSSSDKPLVGVIMGSSSDWEVMKNAVAMLEEFGVAYEARVISAHRMPQDMADYGAVAQSRGLRAIIAGAGGAAHLPGMMAALTEVPVFGVPVPSRYLRGEDSLLSIVQMPKGVPVATFAIGEAGAANAALHAIANLATTDDALRARLVAFRARQTEAARAMALPPGGQA